MADSISPDDVRKELEKQIADLRKEISALGKSIADRSAETLERTREAASEAVDRAKGQTRASFQQAREQAYAVSDAVREHPGTAATILSSAGVVGFVIGLFVGANLLGNERR
ncbi:DUF883 family protein [Labrys okinawensis]|nr:DUF883 family protein [Labrys okinawensis]